MQSAKQTSQGAASKNALPSSRAKKGLDKHELAFLPAALEIVAGAGVEHLTLQPDPNGLGHQFMQEAQPLGCNLDVGDIDAGRVAAWPGNQS
jgi:hypothetical protein